VATSDASIKKALSSQEDLKRRGEHCSADPQALAAIDCAVGQQLRVIAGASEEYALYTVGEVRQESPQDVVRMGLVGRRRLGTDEELSAVLDTQVAHPTLSDDEAEASSEFVERLDDDGRSCGLIAIAPHGGSIEAHTDEQAERVASRLAAAGVSSWRCKGWRTAAEPSSAGTSPRPTSTRPASLASAR
jgi:hypothetical protein